MKRTWLLAPTMLAAFAWAGAQTAGSTGSGIGGSTTSTGAGTTATTSSTLGSQNTQAGGTVGSAGATAGTTPGSTVGQSTNTTPGTSTTNPSGVGTTQSTIGLVGVAVFVCVFAPVAEEFFFRGFLFGVLRQIRVTVAGRDAGTWIAAIITGILFGLAHAGSALSQDLIPLGFLGFVLCLVRWRTRSLYPCIALHSLNNSVALGATQFHWSGGEIVGLIVGSLAVIGVFTLPLAGPAEPA